VLAVDVSVMVIQVVGGFTLGAIIGYALRVLGKIVLLAIGLALLPLVILWHFGVLYVDWAALNRLVGEFVLWLSGGIKSIEEGLAGAGVFGLSTTVGFVFGLFSGFRHSALYEREYRFVKRKNR